MKCAAKNGRFTPATAGLGDFTGATSTPLGSRALLGDHLVNFGHGKPYAAVAGKRDACGLNIGFIVVPLDEHREHVEVVLLVEVVFRRGGSGDGEHIDDPGSLVVIRLVANGPRWVQIRIECRRQVGEGKFQSPSGCRAFVALQGGAEFVHALEQLVEWLFFMGVMLAAARSS